MPKVVFYHCVKVTLLLNIPDKSWRRFDIIVLTSDDVSCKIFTRIKNAMKITVSNQKEICAFMQLINGEAQSDMFTKGRNCVKTFNFVQHLNKILSQVNIIRMTFPCKCDTFLSPMSATIMVF